MFCKRDCAEEESNHFASVDREQMRLRQLVRDGNCGEAIPTGYERLARTMFGPIKNLISNLVGDAGTQPRSNDNDGRLTTAALLVRVATVHSGMSKVRKQKLHAILKAGSALDDLAVAQLIDEAVEIDRTAIDLYHCTRRLNKILDDHGRRYVVKMMWKIVCAGNVNALEDNIIWRAADLLGVFRGSALNFAGKFQLTWLFLLAVTLPDSTHRRDRSITESIHRLIRQNALHVSNVVVLTQRAAPKCDRMQYTFISKY
jgi:uncharacterized tellurite resistance protein B-like protein